MENNSNRRNDGSNSRELNSSSSSSPHSSRRSEETSGDDASGNRRLQSSPTVSYEMGYTLYDVRVASPAMRSAITPRNMRRNRTLSRARVIFRLPSIVPSSAIANAVESTATLSNSTDSLRSIHERIEQPRGRIRLRACQPTNRYSDSPRTPIHSVTPTESPTRSNENSNRESDCIENVFANSNIESSGANKRQCESDGCTHHSDAKRARFNNHNEISLISNQVSHSNVPETNQQLRSEEDSVNADSGNRITRDDHSMEDSS